MSDNPLAVDNLENEDIIMLMAAAMQAPGVEGAVLGLPVLLWGAPGVGKTSRINKVARKLGFYNKDLTVLASVREPSDFLGLPIPGGEPVMVAGKEVPALTFAPPMWAVQANQHSADTGDPRDDKAVVFFDEFSTAGERVMSAMLRVIHERVVGEFTLHKNVAMLAAANPPSMSPGGEDLKPPVANRFIHLYWTPPTADQWANWLTGQTASATQAVDASLKEDPDYLKLDVEEFNRQFAELKIYFADWVRTPQGSKYLFKMPDDGVRGDLQEYFDANPNGGEIQLPDGTTGHTDPAIAPQGSIGKLTYDSRFTDIYAWPSPRSLEMACRGRAAVRATKGIPLEKRFKLENEIVCGTIGTEACMSINDFISQQTRRRIPPAEFVGSSEKRNYFFSKNPDVTTQSLQLQTILTYWRELPIETARSEEGNFHAAVLSFGGEGVDASDWMPMTPTFVQRGFAPTQEFVKKNRELINTDEDLRWKIKSSVKVYKELKTLLEE